MPEPDTFEQSSKTSTSSSSSVKFAGECDLAMSYSGFTTLSARFCASGPTPRRIAERRGALLLDLCVPQCESFASRAQQTSAELRDGCVLEQTSVLHLAIDALIQVRPGAAELELALHTAARHRGGKPFAQSANARARMSDDDVSETTATLALW